MSKMPKRISGRAESAATVIGRGSLVDGVFDIDHQVHVDGKLSGRLSTSDALVVGEDGSVDADEIQVGEAIIRGRVAGKLKASRRVYLTATAYFRGSVETPHLVIEEGAHAEFSSYTYSGTVIKSFPKSPDRRRGPTPEGEVAAGDPPASSD